MTSLLPQEVAVVLLAHGSPDPRHARDIASLVAATVAELGPGALVAAAYLDHHGPTPTQCAAALIARGAAAAVIMPVFTARGFHVRVDVPRAADAMAAAGLAVTIASPGLAGSPALVTLALADQVARRQPAVLFAAGSTDAMACAGLRSQVQQLSRESGVPLATAFLTGGPDLPAALAECAARGQEADDPAVVPFVVADGVLRDQMANATGRAGLALEPGSLVTRSGLARLVIAGASGTVELPATA